MQPEAATRGANPQSTQGPQQHRSSLNHGANQRDTNAEQIRGNPLTNETQRIMGATFDKYLVARREQAQTPPHMVKEQ